MEMTDSNTVSVRVRIAVRPNGEWIACGDSEGGTEFTLDTYLMDIPDGAHIQWISAEVPLPSSIAGTIESVDG